MAHTPKKNAPNVVAGKQRRLLTVTGLTQKRVNPSSRQLRSRGILKRCYGVHEPLAVAGEAFLADSGYLLGTEAGKAFCHAHGIGDTVRNGTHIIWTTGGRLAPPAMHDDWRAKAMTG